MLSNSNNNASCAIREINISEEMLTSCQSILDNSKNIEDVLMYLRKQGYSKAWAILILFKLLDIEFKEIQKLVHFSTTWADVRERDAKFFKDMVDSVNKAYEETGGTITFDNIDEE